MNKISASCEQSSKIITWFVVINETVLTDANRVVLETGGRSLNSMSARYHPAEWNIGI